jgi:hypothetical protein
MIIFVTKLLIVQIQILELLVPGTGNQVWSYSKTRVSNHTWKLEYAHAQ